MINKSTFNTFGVFGLQKIDICEELHQNFIDFAYEANSQRAFADARDGLKPGQRACLWEMYNKGYTSNKPHVKSAKISGGVIANWWPHGDAAIYETFARMSQSWINNIPEVDWHGANGSQIISGEPAASRYTEARLSKAVEEGLFNNIKQNTVNMIKNFSEDDEWPEVLPALYPRLMINGCQGIGVTIANVWLPHELSDLVPVINKFCDTYNTTKEVDYTNLYPSFPSGGIIINKNEVKNIYETGKGKVVLRAKTEIKGNSIYITEFPYQVYIESWIDSVKKLIASDDIAIESIYNRSNKKGILVEVECSGNPEGVLKKLFKDTDLQKSYSANQFALVGKTPQLLNLKEYLTIYIQHNINCIYNEYKFIKEKAKDRKEVVDGLLKALADINNIIEEIKKSSNSIVAKETLMKVWDFTEKQAKAILAMKLSSLTKLDGIELEKEAAQLESTIKICDEILTNADKQMQIFIDRFNAFAKKYGKPRKTEVIQVAEERAEKEVAAVVPEDVVVVTTKSGLIKRIPKTSFKTQRRNGKGTKTLDEALLSVVKTSTIDNVLIFTNSGKMYKLLVDNVPIGTNASKGTNIKQLVKMSMDEEVIAVTTMSYENNSEYVMFFTKNGLVKKTAFDEYSKVKRGTGIAAITLKEGDSLVNVVFVNSNDLVQIITARSYSIKFNSNEVSATGRTTQGVKGIKLDNDYVIQGLVVQDSNLAVFTTNGYGKQIKPIELTAQARGGKGVQLSKTPIAGAAYIKDADSILLIGSPNSICISTTDIPVTSKIAMGNIMIKDSTITKVVTL